nr:unnamed protein product [Haemonchus contortus]
MPRPSTEVIHIAIFVPRPTCLARNQDRQVVRRCFSPILLFSVILFADAVVYLTFYFKGLKRAPLAHRQPGSSYSW